MRRAVECHAHNVFSRKANIGQVAKWIAPLGFLFALALHLGERLLCIEDGNQQDMILDIIYYIYTYIYIP